MHDYRVGRAFGVLRAICGTALQPVFGIVNCVLVGDFGLCDGLCSDAQARLIHHGEHCAHAFVGFTQKIAGGAVIVHYARGIAVQAHFGFDLARSDGVALTQRAVTIYHPFGYNKQRYPFDSVWSPRNSS